jgi:hypothetical protein
VLPQEVNPYEVNVPSRHFPPLFISECKKPIVVEKAIDSLVALRIAGQYFLQYGSKKNARRSLKSQSPKPWEYRRLEFHEDYVRIDLHHEDAVGISFMDYRQLTGFVAFNVGIVLGTSSGRVFSLCNDQISSEDRVTLDRVIERWSHYWETRQWAGFGSMKNDSKWCETILQSRLADEPCIRFESQFSSQDMKRAATSHGLKVRHGMPSYDPLLWITLLGLGIVTAGSVARLIQNRMELSSTVYLVLAILLAGYSIGRLIRCYENLGRMRVQSRIECVVTPSKYFRLLSGQVVQNELSLATIQEDKRWLLLVCNGLIHTMLEKSQMKPADILQIREWLHTPIKPPD